MSIFGRWRSENESNTKQNKTKQNKVQVNKFNGRFWQLFNYGNLKPGQFFVDTGSFPALFIKTLTSFLE